DAHRMVAVRPMTSQAVGCAEGLHRSSVDAHIVPSDSGRSVGPGPGDRQVGTCLNATRGTLECRGCEVYVDRGGRLRLDETGGIPRLVVEGVAAFRQRDRLRILRPTRAVDAEHRENPRPARTGRG